MDFMMIGLLASLFMGMTLGVFGAGGSILTVPILVFLMGVAASEATAYSLFIVGITAIFGAYTYYKQDLIQFKIGFVFAIPAFVGVYSVRLFLMPALPEHIASFGGYDLSKDALVLIVFSLIMIMAAYAMIKPSKVQPTEENKVLNFPLIAVEGLVVGAVTGFVGAGGGFLIIPALVILAGLNMKQAVGTSLMIISFKSLLGFMGDIQAGLVVDWMLLFEIVGLSIIGVLIGERVSRQVDGHKLKPAFGYFVLIMGLAILAREVLA
ncbi:MAG: sulfite exporter TauE/SafE family protein [Ghiorsea sp.]|nr:sulfite exporter TauE/SafE family protein [Ghiorsea sp.]